MALKERIKNSSSRAFINPQFASLSILNDSDGNVYGWIISPEFSGLSDEERQEKVWTCLRDNLDQADLIKISLLFTFTFEELDEDSSIKGKLEKVA